MRMNNITIIGSGYVGLVSGTCLADFGLAVTCVDIDEKKIDNLKNGIIPIYEPGLDSLVERNIYYKRLSFTTDTKAAVESSEVIFIAVGTPPADDGSADLTYVLAAARSIAESMNGYKVIVDKSTVPVGTGRLVMREMQRVLDARGVDFGFDMVSNPEFLREGSAVQDFTHPDRVVLGVESKRAEDMMRDVYRVLFLNETPFVITNLETAEMIKYASNAFLAVKITFINEVANLCEKVGADVHHVASAMGRDGRIGRKFLHPGPGYGGSCFPKDTLAIAHTGRKNDCPMTLVEAAITANEHQKLHMVDKIVASMGDVEGKTIAVLGLAFKPNTDDMRDAPSLTILPELVRRGAVIRAFDPKQEKEASWRFKDIVDRLTLCEDEYQAIDGADAVILLTEWNQFRSLDLGKVKSCMSGRWFFDFRNIYVRKELEALGFSYDAVGR
jgi:UDPglucose 6-dehydrogenase